MVGATRSTAFKPDDDQLQVNYCKHRVAERGAVSFRDQELDITNSSIPQPRKYLDPS